MPSSDDAMIHLTTLKGGSYLTGLLYDDRIGKKNGEFDCVITDAGILMTYLRSSILKRKPLLN